MQFSLHKSRSKTAQIFQFLNTLAVSRQVRWPVSCPPVLYLLLAQGVGFWEKCNAKQRFYKKDSLRAVYAVCLTRKIANRLTLCVPVFAKIPKNTQTA